MCTLFASLSQTTCMTSHELQRWAAASNTLWTHQSCSGAVWTHKTILTPHTGTASCLVFPANGMISSGCSHTHRTMQHTILYTLPVHGRPCIHKCMQIMHKQLHSDQNHDCIPTTHVDHAFTIATCIKYVMRVTGICELQKSIGCLWVQHPPQWHASHYYGISGRL